MAVGGGQDYWQQTEHLERPRGKDRLYGGKNDDILIGGGGKDKCWGQQNDTFESSAGLAT